jgi:hypothetical protein
VLLKAGKQSEIALIQVGSISGVSGARTLLLFRSTVEPSERTSDRAQTIRTVAHGNLCAPDGAVNHGAAVGLGEGRGISGVVRAKMVP